MKMDLEITNEEQDYMEWLLQHDLKRLEKSIYLREDIAHAKSVLSKLKRENDLDTNF